MAKSSHGWGRGRETNPLGWVGGVVAASRSGYLRKGKAAVDVTNLNQISPFITLDGSEIRELLAYRNSAIRHQSLAEARLPPGGATTPHFHRLTEEIYFILEGTGMMRVADEWREVQPGDAIAIPPGAHHQICNTGDVVLRLLCCCAPCYEHSDTVLLPEEQGKPWIRS